MKRDMIDENTAFPHHLLNVAQAQRIGATALAAGYTRAESEGAGLATLKGTGFSLLGTYSLSKRTTAYAGLINTERESGTTAAFTTTKVLTSAVGLRHTF